MNLTAKIKIMRPKMYFGLGGSIQIINSPLSFFCQTRLVFLMIVDALDYVLEAERDMQECYDSMDADEKAFIDDNSMFVLHTDELGRGYYV